MTRPERGPDAPSARTPAHAVARAVWIPSLPDRSRGKKRRRRRLPRGPSCTHGRHSRPT